MTKDAAAPLLSPRPRRWRRRFLVLALLLSAYPTFVLGVVYTLTLRSDLPGGRNGPKDAFRHTLASAIVAYTTSPTIVQWVTDVMEGGKQTASRSMDRHNNRIGAELGAEAHSLRELVHAVRAAIAGGSVVAIDPFRSEAGRIAWLPPRHWVEAPY
jgi:hypothetical protein